MSGIVAYGAYLPLHRLSRKAIGAVLAQRGGPGARSVASYDEDTTSMAVEAGRRALAMSQVRPDSVLLATTAPAYTDKTNATAVHAALGLDRAAGAYDLAGSVRSGVAALCAAADSAAAGRAALAVLSDIRVGMPGSADESDGGDAAAALLFAADGPFVAQIIAHHAVTAEFLDRWRVPGEAHSRVWEERFGETVYVPLAREAFQGALERAGVDAGAVDHWLVTGVHPRAARQFAASAGVRPEALAEDLTVAVGMTGAAHPGLLLASVLERVRPGEVVALLVLADGADCIVLRAGDAAGAVRPAVPMAAQLDGPEVAYNDYLIWRGLLRRQPPRRPDPDRPAAPPSLRNSAWKFGFTAGRCGDCGTRHLPPARVCLRCHATDRMVPDTLVDARGTVTTFTVDRLAYSLAPPVVAAVVDFEGGGRLQCELTDVDPARVAVGDRVELTFRRLHTTADGVHDYFWKARPVRAMED